MYYPLKPCLSNFSASAWQLATWNQHCQQSLLKNCYGSYHYSNPLTSTISLVCRCLLHPLYRYRSGISANFPNMVTCNDIVSHWGSKRGYLSLCRPPLKTVQNQMQTNVPIFSHIGPFSWWCYLSLSMCTHRHSKFQGKGVFFQLCPWAFSVRKI